MKLLTVALMFLILVSCGCGNKYSNEVSLKKGMAWTETKENARDLLDALETNDKDFFVQLYADGKIKEVDKETKINVTNELNDGKIIEIKFLQGRYKNKVGYTLPRFIEDIGEKRAQEKKRAEQESVRFFVFLLTPMASWRDSSP